MSFDRNTLMEMDQEQLVDLVTRLQDRIDAMTVAHAAQLIKNVAYTDELRCRFMKSGKFVG